MSTALSTPAAPKTSALAVMAERLSVEPSKLLSTLKATVFKGASDDEMLALVVVANEYRLNPLLKEIYAFPAKGGGIVPVISVDGWVSMVNDHPQMDGLEFEVHEEGGRLVAITCTIFRKDRNRPIRVTEYLSECRRNTEPWKMEHRMLRHKALMQCARYAFGFSGATDEDEAENTPGMRTVTPGPVVAADPFQPPPPDAEVIDVEPDSSDREELGNKILSELDFYGVSVPSFEGACRKAGLMRGAEMLSSLSAEKLQAILDHGVPALCGTIGVGKEEA